MKLELSEFQAKVLNDIFNDIEQNREELEEQGFVCYVFLSKKQVRSLQAIQKQLKQNQDERQNN